MCMSSENLNKLTKNLLLNWDKSIFCINTHAHTQFSLYYYKLKSYAKGFCKIFFPVFRGRAVAL